MDKEWRYGGIFAAGLALGALAAVAGYAWWSQRDTGGDGLAQHQPMTATPVAPADGATVQSAALPPPKACGFDPLIAPRSDGDGVFALHAAVANQPGNDPTAFLSVAEEASVQGRARDTEVALIAACRVAARETADAVPVADVQTRLSQHYTAIAMRERDLAARLPLIERADQLLAASARAYEATLGRQASRTRVAVQRLESFRRGSQALAAGQDLAAPPASTAEGVPNTGMLGSSPRSLTEQVPRTDEALAEVDADLQRLYDQARSVSRDPAGVQRRHQEALARRQACPDEACLRAWYAQRRRQLFSEF